MVTNELPSLDMSDCPTNCCPRFNPDGWDNMELHFENKQFIRAVTRSFLYIPINFGSVFKRVSKAIEDNGATPENTYFVLSRDLSPFKSEHYFAVSKEVPGETMTTLTGKYRTKVFEGPYSKAFKWVKETEEFIKSKGEEPEEISFFYTTCPKCAKYYGKNYVVAVGKVKQV